MTLSAHGFARLLVQPQDTSEMLLQKWFAAGILAFMTVVNSALSFAGGVCWPVCAGTGALMLMVLCYTRSLPPRFVAVIVAYVFINVCAVDLMGASTGSRRSWMALCVVVDFLIVAEAPRLWSYGALVVACAWIVLLEAELKWSFGLLAAFGSSHSSHGETSKEHVVTVSAIATLYCLAFTTNAAVVMGLMRQKAAEAAKGARQAAAVAGVVECLVISDLEGAGDALAGAAMCLTDEVQVPLWRLAACMRRHKPYLPSAEARDPALLVTPPEEALAAHDSGLFSTASQSIQPRRHDVHAADSASFVGTASTVSTVATRSVLSALRSPTGGSFQSLKDAGPHGPIGMDGPWSGGYLKHTKMALLSIRILLQADDMAADVRNLQVHEKFAACVARCVGQGRGVVDAINGDEIVASFNASQQCFLYASTAVRAARNFAEEFRSVHADLEVCGAVAGGHCSVGVLGTAALSRQVFVGALPHQLSQHSRYAAASAHRWVVNSHVYAEASIEHPFRIILDQVILEDPYVSTREPGERALRSRPVPCTLYDIAEITDNAGHPTLPLRAVASHEWMYDQEESRVWDAYNEAGRIHRSHGLDAALRHLQRRDSSSDVVARFRRSVEASSVMDFSLPWVHQRKSTFATTASSRLTSMTEHTFPRDPGELGDSPISFALFASVPSRPASTV